MDQEAIMVNGGESIARRIKTTFAATLKKFGNSYHVVVATDIAKKMMLDDGDDIDVTIAIPETDNKNGGDAE